MEAFRSIPLLRDTHFILTACILPLCSQEHLDVLLASGADIDARDVDGKTALHWTVRSGKTKCLRKLLTYAHPSTVNS